MLSGQDDLKVRIVSREMLIIWEEILLETAFLTNNNNNSSTLSLSFNSKCLAVVTLGILFVVVHKMMGETINDSDRTRPSPTLRNSKRNKKKKEGKSKELKKHKRRHKDKSIER